MTSRDLRMQKSLHLIDLIYDAVEDPSRWPAFIEAAVRATGGTYGVLLLAPPGREAAAIWCFYGWLEQDLRLHAEHYMEGDLWRRGIGRLPEGMVGTNFDLCSEQEMHESVAFREFYAPRNCYYGCGCTILRTSTGLSALSMGRGKESGPYTERELAILRPLIPHLQRAARLHGELSFLRAQTSGIERVMDLYPTSYLQTDADCTVVYANTSARQISGQALSIESGQLRLESPRANYVLRQAVRKAAADPRLQLRRLDVERDLHGASYRLLLMPVPKSQGPLGMAQPSVSILVLDMSSAARPDPALLGELFGLTPAEANFTSALVSGASVDEISTELGITRETARTHMRRVLSKTHTHRQGELISLVLRSIPFPRA